MHQADSKKILKFFFGGIYTAYVWAEHSMLGISSNNKNITNAAKKENERSNAGWRSSRGAAFGKIIENLLIPGSTPAWALFEKPYLLQDYEQPLKYTSEDLP